MLNKRLNRLRLFYPMLFTIYVFSITLFTHSHYINNIRFIHSHPYKFSDPPIHEHSAKELQLLDQLFNTSLTSDIIPDIDLTGIISVNNKNNPELYQQFHIISLVTSLKLRAPPSFF